MALSIFALCASLGATLGPALAHAQSTPASEPPEAPPALSAAAPLAPRTPDVPAATPAIHHAPVSTAKAGVPLSIEASIDHPELVRHAAVVYRTTAGVLRSAPLLRGEGGGYVAVIPAEDMVAPGISYAIELERIDGVRTFVFATRDDMQPIMVLEELADIRERILDKRLDGRRSVVTASSEVVRFGQTTGTALPCAGTPNSNCALGTSKTPVVDDQYWRIEAGYTYRPLRTIAEFSLRGGVVRGTSLVALNQYDESKYKVGLNYGAADVRFRFADNWHLEWELLTSITEVGFSVGTGGALLIGDPYGTKLTVGFETIGIATGTYFGSRFYSRVDIVAGKRVTVAPIIEVTDMPHAESFGVRLLGDLGVALGGGFGLGLRGGYQARLSTSGGPTFGGTLSLAF